MTCSKPRRSTSPQQVSDNGDEGFGPVIVFTTGAAAISGAIMGFLLAGDVCAAGCVLGFSLLAGWIGWVGRGLS